MAPKPTGNPFVGLRQFELDDWSVFFGREQEAKDLLNLVLVFPAVLLYSKSGAGKSSLVNAGLAPLAAAQGKKLLPPARVVGPLRPAERRNPLIANSINFLNASETDPGLADAPRLVDYLAGRSDRNEDRILVFDQFEECFTQVLPFGQREEFFQDVAGALNQAQSGLSVLFVIREEYVAELDPYLRLLPGRLNSRLRIRPLARDAARLALTGPLQKLGVVFEPGAAEELLDSLSRQRVQDSAGGSSLVPGEFIEPVQLQVVATGLWQSVGARGADVITAADVRSLGAEQALAVWLEKTVHQVAQHTAVRYRKILSWCRENLITAANTRAIVFRGESHTAGMPNSVVDELENQHVLRRELRAGAVWDELSHDQLVSAVLAALESVDRAAGSEQERSRVWEGRASRWAEGGRSAKDLLSSGQAAEAAAWAQSPEAQDMGVTPLLLEYIEASLEADRRAIRERRRLRSGIAVLTVLLLCLSGLAIWLRSTRDQIARQTTVEIELRNRNNLNRLQAIEARLSADKTNAELQVRARELDAAKSRERELVEQKTNAEQRRTTAYSLAGQAKSMVGRGQTLTALPDPVQSAYKAAYLAGYVTYKNDKDITPEAAEALRGVLPSQDVRGLPLSPFPGLPVPLNLTQGGLAYSESDFGTLRVWSLKQRTLAFEVRVPAVPVNAIPNRWLADYPPRYVIRENDSVLIIDLPTRAQFGPYKVATTVDVFGITADNRLIMAIPPSSPADAIGTQVPAIRVPRLEYALLASDAEFRSAVFAQLDIQNASTHIEVWRLRGPERTASFDTRHAVTSIAISSDNKVLMTSSDSGPMLRIAGVERTLSVAGDPPTPLPPCAFTGSSPLLAFNPAGDAAIASCFGADNQWHSWVIDVNKGTALESDPKTQPTLSPFGGALAFSWVDDNTFVRRDPDNTLTFQNRSGQMVDRRNILVDSASAVSFSTGDKQVFSFVRGQSPTVWDVVDRALVRNTASPEGVFASSAVDPEGKWLALAGRSGVELRPLGSGAQKPAHALPFPAYRLAVAVDAKRVAAADLFGQIHVFSPGGSGETLIKAGASLVALAISDSGSLVSAVTLDGVARAWTADGAPLHTPAAKAKATAVSFQGEELILGREDGSVSIVEPHSGRVLRSAPLNASSGPVRAFAVDRIHSLLAVGGDLRTVVWRQKGPTGLDYRFSSEVYANIAALAFNSRGTQLATLTGDGALRVAPIQTVDLMDEVFKLINPPIKLEDCRELGAQVCPTGIGESAPLKLK